MTGVSCEWESAVLEAARSDRLSTEIRDHASCCSRCRDALMVEGYLASLAREPVAGRPATAGQVWWRAERRARREDLARATRPITALRWASLVIGAALAIYLAAWAWPVATAWTHRLLAVERPGIDLTAVSTAGSLLALLSALLPFVALALWWSWAHE